MSVGIFFLAILQKPFRFSFRLRPIFFFSGRFDAKAICVFEGMVLSF